MTAYTLELSCRDAAGRGASPQPPDDLPPDGSNI
jgi:4,5-DOPA dioxygenase extradiol